MKSIVIVAAALLAAFPAFGHDVTAGEIKIEGAAARAMVPGAKVGGGYLTIENTGSSADRLLSASSDRAGSVQVHEMSTDNGIMVMRELKDGLSIPAGQSVDLMPGGHHLMFMDVTKPFKQGEEIKAVLTFEKAGPVEVEFEVGPMAGPLNAGHTDHGSMEMGSMPGMDMSSAADGEAAKSIPAILKTMFETAEKPLTVEPVVVQNDWAIAGWQQDGRGGRALLKKTHHGWAVHLCSGDSIKNAAALEKIGLTAADASALAAKLASAEASLDPNVLSLFASFEGTVMMGSAEDTAGHNAHEGHAK